MVYAVLKVNKSKSKPIFKTTYNFKDLNEELFKREMNQAPGWISNIFDNIEDSVFAFESLFQGTVRDHLKVRTAKVRSRNLPWDTREIRKLMNKRYKALIKWQRNKENNSMKECYQKLRNEVTRALKMSESNYRREQFAAANTCREFWKTVNNLKSKMNDERIGPLWNDQKTLVFDDKEKATLMNAYLAEIGKKLSEGLGSEHNAEDASYITRITPTCQLAIDEKQLDRQFDSLKPNKATGHDGIGSKILKISEEGGKEGIRTLIQASFSTKKFPDSCKLAKLKTIHKKGVQKSRENYRPLSILSIPSKLAEGQICSIVDKHMDSSGVAHPNQWGYKQGRSTEGLLLHLTEKW